MTFEKFDPRGKTFHFRLGQETCYRCKTGKCSLEDISLEELREGLSNLRINGRGSIEYCREMAKCFLDDKFFQPITINLHKWCGHYSFSDGQHRTCVVARILQKGTKVVLNAEISETESICGDCYCKKGFAKKEDSMSMIDKVFKTKKYKCFEQVKNDYKKHQFIYSFDN